MLDLDENKLEKYREEILKEFVSRPDIVPEFNRFFNRRIKKILVGNKSENS
jgi:hypothetical protein